MGFWAILGGMAKKAVASKVGAMSGSQALGASVGKKIGAGDAPTTMGGQIGQGLINKAMGVGGGSAKKSPTPEILPDDTSSQRITLPQRRQPYGMRR